MAKAGLSMVHGFVFAYSKGVPKWVKHRTGIWEPTELHSISLSGEEYSVLLAQFLFGSTLGAYRC